MAKAKAKNWAASAGEALVARRDESARVEDVELARVEGLKALVEESAHDFFDELAEALSAAVEAFNDVTGAPDLDFSREGWNQASASIALGDYLNLQIDLSDDERPAVLVDTRLSGREDRVSFSVAERGGRLGVQLDDKVIGAEDFLQRAAESWMSRIDI